MSAPANFADRLAIAVRAKATPTLIGLDPHLDLLPPEYAGARDNRLPRPKRAEQIGDFCCHVVDLIADLVPAVKPQSAFFEALGADGVAQWERVIEHSHQRGLLVIGDVKRGDIQSTARAYATACLEGAGGSRAIACDAVTLNPFLGSDSIEPFLEVCARTNGGAFVLVRTSNKGSADFQRHGSPELSHRIAESVVRWGQALIGECGLSSIGAVVGATHAAELADFRTRMPNNWLLLPGYGAQGASAADVVHAFRADGLGALVNSSRGILFAHREARYSGMAWPDATQRATRDMIDELRGARHAH